MNIAAAGASRARVLTTAGIAAAIVVALLPFLASPSIIFKSGAVLIFLIGAIGLHILVNWAGELSLAHGVMVGTPAFSVVAVSEAQSVSPIYLLPMAVVIGAAIGLIVGLPALRASGTQVALVTLVAGVALSRFLFTQKWLVGSTGGRAAEVPTLGPWTLSTTKQLYPVLLAATAVAVLAAFALFRSKFARGWAWVRENPDAAAAFGVPVVLYRIAAFGIAGGFAGAAGGLTAVWTRRLDAAAFPLTTSFEYLIVVVLAGPGFVGGVFVAVLIVQGGHRFATDIFGTENPDLIDALIAYGGSIGLLQVIALHPNGFNGVGRHILGRRTRLVPEAPVELESPILNAEVTP